MPESACLIFPNLKFHFPWKFSFRLNTKRNFFGDFVHGNSWDNEKNCFNELSKQKIDMQYNWYDCYGKPNFLPALHLICCIDFQITGKGILIVLKKINGGEGNSYYSTSSLKKPSDLCQAKSKLWSFSIHHDLIYEPFDS